VAENSALRWPKTLHFDGRKFCTLRGQLQSNVIGFIALKVHNEYTVEMYNLGVLEEYHRQGVGHAMLTAVESYCRERGYKFITVKTLDSSAEYEPYERTRAFYRKNGFYPLEVFPLFWNEENPCLFLAKYIG